MEGNNSSLGFTVGRDEKSDQSGASNMAAPAPIYTPMNFVPEVKKKKKRGRPRKYERDGTITALSPMPISAAIPPLTGNYTSTWKHDRPVYPFKKKKKLEFGRISIGDGQPLHYSFGANFTPHILIVNAGEDVSNKIILFSQQGSKVICILAANGAISNVTLRQPNSSGGTLTYEGRFEIVSLTGSFMPTDDGVTKSRSGGMSVCLSGSDGRILGGGLAGLLVAASPVQVVIGSFFAGHQLEQKPKKQKSDEFTINYSSVNETDGSFCKPRPNLTSVSPNQGKDVMSPTPLNSIPNPNSTAPTIISFAREESKKCETSF